MARASADGGRFERAVTDAVRSLRHGEVASYGEIAEQAGYPEAARAVGGVLSRSSGLPWWRVVGADGTLMSPNAKEQARRLMNEGVPVDVSGVSARARPVGEDDTRRQRRRRQRRGC